MIFGDTVIIDITNAAAEEKAKLDAAVLEKSTEELVEGGRVHLTDMKQPSSVVKRGNGDSKSNF